MTNIKSDLLSKLELANSLDEKLSIARKALSNAKDKSDKLIVINIMNSIKRPVRN